MGDPDVCSLFGGDDESGPSIVLPNWTVVDSVEVGVVVCVS